MESVLELLIPVLSVTWTVKVKLPLLEGVPLTVPVWLKLTPTGRPPAVRAHVYGGVPPEAVRICE